MTATTPRPRNIYQDALDAQGACNLGALVHGFDRVVTALQLEMRTNGEGTGWLNKHPAVVLFVEQLHHLSGSSRTYRTAYAECESKAREALAPALPRKADSPCDECGALIPADEPSTVNAAHLPSCSLHPANSV
jgi:hypothetical protein